MKPEFQAFGIDLAELELHRDSDGRRTMVGYASAFDFPIPGDNGETVFIRPGAWNKTLKERREHIQVLYDHGHDPQLGDKPLGVPATIRPDGKGLWTETPLAQTSYNDEIIIPLLDSGALRSMSVAFVTQQQSWNDDHSERYIEQSQLWEFGPTPFPRNLGASAALHSLRWREVLEEHWNGPAALASCSGAAEFRKIAFERSNDSDPDTAAHWALPHHPSPEGAPGNADRQGVGAAIAALNGARGGAPNLKDASAARSHLEAHQRAFEAESSSEDDRSTEEAAASPEPDRPTDERLVIEKARVSSLRLELEAEGRRIDRWVRPTN